MTITIGKKDKKYIDATASAEVDDQNMEAKEGDQENMEKVGFFTKHKKGLIAAGVAVLGTVAGIAALSKKRSNDDDEDYLEDFDDDFDESDGPVEG